MQYVPYHKLGDSPNIIVDGRSNQSTVLTLSHWPGSDTPQAYRDDLSAQIVYKFLEDRSRCDLDRPDLRRVDCVSNNHFDEDGLVSLFSIIHPQMAEEHKDIFVDIARAGDFGVFENRDAARVSFVLSAWANSELSPLNSSVFARPYPELTAILYQELLLRLPKIIEKIDHLKRYWQEEDEFYDLTQAAIAEGKVTLREHEAIDLLEVTVEAGFPGIQREHPASWISSVLHPMALHNRSQCSRVVVMQGRHYELYYRYESWVDFVSRQIPKRLDLTALAAKLSALEKDTRWQFTGVDEIIARLQMVYGQKSQISPEVFMDRVKSYLAG